MATLGARLLLSCHQVPLFCVTTRLGSLGERIRSRLKRSARVALAHSPPQPRWVRANEEGARRPNCPRGSPAANLERYGRSRPSLQGPPPGARRLGQQWGPGGVYPAGDAGGQTRLTTGGSLFGSEWTTRCRKGRGAPLAVIHLGGMNGGEVRVCASQSSAGTPGRQTARVI